MATDEKNPEFNEPRHGAEPERAISLRRAKELGWVGEGEPNAYTLNPQSKGFRTCNDVLDYFRIERKMPAGFERCIDADGTIDLGLLETQLAAANQAVDSVRASKAAESKPDEDGFTLIETSDVQGTLQRFRELRDSPLRYPDAQ